MENKLIFTVGKANQTQYDHIVLAKNGRPKWFNSQPPRLDQPKSKHLGPKLTIAGCPSVKDFYETGYIVKAWTDILIQQNTNEYNSENQVQVDGANSSVKWDWLDVNDLIPVSDHNFKNPIIRLCSDIEISATKDTSLLMLSALEGHPELKVFEGITPVDKYPVELKVMFAVMGDSREIFIPYGTPLLRLIPLNRTTYTKEKRVVERRGQTMISKCPFFKLSDYLKNVGWVKSSTLFK